MFIFKHNTMDLNNGDSIKYENNDIPIAFFDLIENLHKDLLPLKKAIFEICVIL